MSKIIILTEAQADAVRGNTTANMALYPMPLTDGTFFLPAELLVGVHSDRLKAANIDNLAQVDLVSVDAVRPDAIFDAKVAQGETRAQAAADVDAMMSAAISAGSATVG